MSHKIDVKKVANLARIKLDKSEEEKLQKDLDKIVEYVSIIGEAPIPPGWQLPTPENRNIFREDENSHKPSEFSKELLDTVPDSEDGYIKVSNILDGRSK